MAHKITCYMYYNSNNIAEKILREGYSTGLVLALDESASRYDSRIWIVDNSGSMQLGDGSRIIKEAKKGGKQKSIDCTRWDEMAETVKYHAQMASTLDCPTVFQLINDPGQPATPQRFSVCEHGTMNAQEEVSKAAQIMSTVTPSGVTPLTQHIRDVKEYISGRADELKRRGKIVVIILATDGMISCISILVV